MATLMVWSRPDPAADRVALAAQARERIKTMRVTATVEVVEPFAVLAS